MAKSTRDRLLDYSFEEIYKYGYFQANTSAILKKAKIPKGSMYHYFDSKHTLALSVIKERVAPQTIKHYRIRVEHSYIDAFIAFLQKIDFSKKPFVYGCAMHKLIVEMGHLDAIFQKELESIYLQVLEHFTTILDAAITHDEIKKCDSKQQADFIFTTLLGAISLKNKEVLEMLIKELKALKLHKKQAVQPRQQTLF